MSYGKIFASMYEGSMIGHPGLDFALMGYVIANQQPENQKDVTSRLVVELHPVKLSKIFAEGMPEIVAAVDRLCEPDPWSRSKLEGGRRLKKVEGDGFMYWVVNGRYYRDRLREEKDRDEAKIRKRNERLRKQQNGSGGPLPGEVEYCRAIERGASREELEAIEAKYHLNPVASGMSCAVEPEEEP